MALENDTKGVLGAQGWEGGIQIESNWIPLFNISLLSILHLWKGQHLMHIWKMSSTQ